MSCIMPIAPTWDTAFLSNLLSVRMTASKRAGEISSFFALSEMRREISREGRMKEMSERM